MNRVSENGYEIPWNFQREKDGHLRKTDVVGSIDGAKYTMNSEIQVDPTEPIIHVSTTCPSGKTELLFKYKKLGDREYTGIQMST